MKPALVSVCLMLLACGMASRAQDRPPDPIERLRALLCGVRCDSC